MNLDNGPLALALAMLGGVLAQVLASHARIPAIVFLLATGVGLGPDGADIIRPEAMGGGLRAVTGFAVAIILFEGGFSLQLPALRAQGTAIRRLVTIGALVTGGLAAVAAKLIMGWDGRLAILFGTLVIVTGPTVVTPLMRRLRATPKITNILIAEGILIDAVGATIAVFALQIAVAETRTDAAKQLLSILAAWGVGAAVGLVGGFFIVGVHRIRRLVPHGLENVLILATVVVCFQLSNAIVHESGITATIVAGLVVGNTKMRGEREVASFNEALTALFVATLFVALAADVRIADIANLGWRGVAVAGALVFIVRPLDILVSTFRTDLTRREKLYLSWIAPRGIVAAAVASLFATELAAKGVEGGTEMRTLVFVVIAVTVVVQGLTAAPVASLLGVRLPARTGYLILGANELARLVARGLRELGQNVTLVDRDPDKIAVARAAGFDVHEGDGLQREVLVDAGIDRHAHVVALTPNEHVNLLCAQIVAEDLRGPEIYVALERFADGATPEMVERTDGNILFGGEYDLLVWTDRVRRKTLRISRWRLDTSADRGADTATADMPTDHVMFIGHVRGSTIELFTNRTSLRTDDEVIAAIASDAEPAAMAWLAAHGWSPADDRSA